MSHSPAFTSIDELIAAFKAYSNRVEQLISSQWSPRSDWTSVEKACRESLLNGGKRFRPILVYLVGEALLAKQHSCDSAHTRDILDHAALAIEYFHTASLIADDLPCMDNAPERRGAPSTHIEHGEATALLASYALIAEGYRHLTYENAEHPPSIHLAIQWATRCNGIQGAVLGQQIDLFPPDQTLNTYLKIIELKTCRLFELTFVLGWLAGGGDRQPHSLDSIATAGNAFGLAFQIADDIADAEEDHLAGREMNCVLLEGMEKTIQRLQEATSLYSTTLDSLDIHSTALESIPHLLMTQVARI